LEIGRDVKPWVKYGNNPQDKTTPWERGISLPKNLM
jgi:hypothetical protein